MKRLTLEQSKVGENKYQYRVIQLINAINPKIGKVLTEVEATQLCNNSAWTVTIKEGKFQ